MCIDFQRLPAKSRGLVEAFRVFVVQGDQMPVGVI